MLVVIDFWDTMRMNLRLSLTRQKIQLWQMTVNWMTLKFNPVLLIMTSECLLPIHKIALDFHTVYVLHR